MSSGTLTANWAVYLETFREHAHRLLAWAYDDIRSQVTSDTTEPVITGLLARAMKSRLDYHPDTPDTYLNYTIGDQEPVSPKGELGNDRLKLDLSVVRSGIRPRLSYVFEAKRLRTSGYPIGKYTGGGGMGDFIACRYGEENPEAAMVALYQNRDACYWKDELKRVIAEDLESASGSLKTTGQVHEVGVIAQLTDELLTEHKRQNGTSIRLYHIFLDCC